MTAVVDELALADIKTALAGGAAALSLTVTDTQLGRLAKYLKLLEKWNKTYNLTAIRDMPAMIVQHALDSLAIVPALQRLARAGDRLLDVGSGAGLPGIPVAIADSGLAVSLLDSSQKKTAFLRQAVAELGLKNAAVINARVEVWRATPFQVIVSRAYSELAHFLAGAEHLLAAGGLFMAMKGHYPAEEIAALPQRFEVREALRLNVPGLDAERHLIVLAAR